MKNLTLLFLLLASSVFGQYQIGHTTINFQDPNRNNRTIQTEIYYPATTAGDNVAMAAGSFPSIVFGHGFVMSWDAYQNIWEFLVPKGYVMLFPRTEGNILNTNHQAFGWDLQFLVNAIQVENSNSSSIFYQHIKPSTALMGHSMGGGAAFLAADSLCNNQNPYLKTLVGLAPAESSTNGVSSIRSAKKITIPAVIFSGSQDGVTPPIDHHIPMYDSLSSNCKTFINVLGGAHCYFANPNFNCDFGESTASSGISITRQEQHAILFDFVLPWLNYTLKYSCQEFDRFNDSLNLSSRINYQQQCYSHVNPIINFSNGYLYTTATGIGYQWYLNNQVVANSNNDSIVPVSAGNYEVEVIFEDSCSHFSTIYNFIPTNMNMYNYKSLNIFPNPANSYINVEKDFLNKIIHIYDLTGKLIDSKKITETKIDITHLKSGVYILKIELISQKLHVIK